MIFGKGKPVTQPERDARKRRRWRRWLGRIPKRVTGVPPRDPKLIEFPLERISPQRTVA